MDLTVGSKTGSSLARAAVSSPQREDQALYLSSSEEVDVVSIDIEETVDLPPVPHV